MVKRCPKCGEEKPLTEEFWYIRKDAHDGFRGTCKACTSIQSSNYANGHKDEIRQYYGRYCKENPEKIVNIKKKWVTLNLIKRKDSANQWVKRNRSHCAARQSFGRKELQDWYVRYCLKKETGCLEPSDELIELKRQQIIMHRELKQLKKEVHSGTTGKGNTGTKEPEKGLQDQKD